VIQKYQLKLKPYLKFQYRDESFKFANSHSIFWDELSKNNWEPETFDILDNNLKPHMTYVDIGAWIGPTVCYAATKVFNVIAFEPDPYAFYILNENVKTNNLGNVQLINEAVSEKKGILRMSSFGNSLGDSQTSSLVGTKGKYFYVKTKSINDFSQEVEKIDFLKMDIEGGEFDLIPQMEKFFIKHRPILYISFHSPYLELEQRKDALMKIKVLLSTYYQTFKNERMEIFETSIITSDNSCQSFFSLICEP
jgi:FkbM family methyltransferase